MIQLRLPLLLLSLSALSVASAVAPPGTVLKSKAKDQANTRTVKAQPVVPKSFVAFESGPVRPLAVSADRDWLYATNTPDNRVEAFAITDHGLLHAWSIDVGMEPVALALAPGRNELWVVNHLSDSISVIDLATEPPALMRTLWVGDEPRDIVFAGPDFAHAFVTTAHRGQNAPYDPQLTIPGIGRADVWVFDAGSESSVPLTIVNLFGDTPRALAASADGSRVYAAVFLSGNQTTVLPTGNWNKAQPTTSADGVPQPPSGLIVRRVSNQWTDELGQNWNAWVGMSLPDYDVFEIDARGNLPEEVRRIASVGTVNFNMAVNPITGTLYVSNMDARNHVRFAGVPNRASTSVRGRLANHQISVISGSQVTTADLNPHINYERNFGTLAERNQSLSQPMDMALSGDGQTLYVTAFGSQKLAAFDTDALASGDLANVPVRHAELSAGGPAGVVLDEGRAVAYVLTRFDNGISTVALSSMTESAHLTFHNPEPEIITAGRPFLYDARLTSGRGNDACSVCHVFANTDALAWDLGDPEGTVRDVPNDYHGLTANHPGLNFTWHPMKGPMATQSMRGLARHGPMHWRGDRTGVDAEPGESLESAAFKEFNEAFQGLMARRDQLDAEQMQAFTDFALAIHYPPNPIRKLDNSLTSQQQQGKDLYDQGVIRGDNGVREVCVVCHPINPANGIFGTTGTMAFNGQTPAETDFKIPHFRDQYQKVGSFSWTRLFPFFAGPQVRGFGFNHNGATHGLNNLESLFIPISQMEAIRSYLYAFPSESAPVLGQQVTIDTNATETEIARHELLLERAAIVSPVPECDLIAKGSVSGANRGYVFNRPSQMFLSDRAGEAGVSPESLLSIAQAEGNRLTYTCTPWGSGMRMAVDRDVDGIRDGSERIQGSNPADASSNALTPAAGNWWNPERPGHGLDVQRLNDQLIVTWYTYLDDGTPVWYQTDGPISVLFNAPLRQISIDSSSGEFLVEEVGRLALFFTDATHAEMEWELGDESGSEAMQLLNIGSGLTLRDNTGMWFDSGEPGWGLSVASQGQRRAVVVFFHDNDGTPKWVIGADDNEAESTLEMLTLTGACPGCAFSESVAAPGGSMSIGLGPGTDGHTSFALLGSADDDSPFQRDNVPVVRLSTDPTNVWP